VLSAPHDIRGQTYKAFSPETRTFLLDSSTAFDDTCLVKFYSLSKVLAGLYKEATNCLSTHFQDKISILLKLVLLKMETLGSSRSLV
jgi:hypothetical protein